MIGFDIDKEKLKKLKENGNNQNLVFTDKTEEIGRADSIIVRVPTPVTKSKQADVSHVEDAARITGQNMNMKRW